LFDLSENGGWKRAQRAAKSSVVDGPTLIDHDLALLAVSSDFRGQYDTQHILACQPGGAWKDPSRWMPNPVEQIGLNGYDRPQPPRLCAPSGIQIG
jgi:hypothetical protein